MEGSLAQKVLFLNLLKKACTLVDAQHKEELSIEVFFIPLHSVFFVYFNQYFLVSDQSQRRNSPWKQLICIHTEKDNNLHHKLPKNGLDLCMMFKYL